MIGRTLSHFKITAKLGEGGMGVVWRADDTELDREVAIKVLPAEMAADPARLDRFRREAQAVAALNHPNIVTLYSVAEDQGIHFLVLEVIEGKGLEQVVPPEGLGLESVFDLAIPIADALATAHEKGIIHRDLKPDNVMVTTEGRVKIFDFGLAKLVQRPESDRATELLTRAGTLLGTVPYMSPEQVQGREADQRSDIFSFGILLYEMSTGRRPFGGEDPASVISSILRDEPRPVSELKADLPKHLGRIVRRCLEKDPERRFQAATQLRIELEDLKREVSGVAFETEVRAWRPEPGEVIPHRPRWVVASKLGEGGFGEVWLAQHEKTGDRRVFKFCFEAARLEALQREITSIRLLKEELGQRDDIAGILDWNFDLAPYFIESEYTEGGDLGQWAEEKGGLERVPLEVRLDIVAQVATARRIGDPIAVFGGSGTTRNGQRPRIAPLHGARGRGRRCQDAAGGRVLGWGVLYQMVVGDLSRPLGENWKRDVDDELLRADIAWAVDPPPSVG